MSSAKASKKRKRPTVKVQKKSDDEIERYWRVDGGPDGAEVQISNMGGFLMYMYIANAVRGVDTDNSEVANCRFIEDWDWKEGDKGDRVMMVSTMKVQTGMEWKLDTSFMLRKLGLEKVFKQ